MQVRRSSTLVSGLFWRRFRAGLVDWIHGSTQRIVAGHTDDTPTICGQEHTTAYGQFTEKYSDSRGPMKSEQGRRRAWATITSCPKSVSSQSDPGRVRPVSSAMRLRGIPPNISCRARLDHTAIVFHYHPPHLRKQISD